MQVETVKIAAEKTDGNPHGYIVINKADFKEGEHQLFEECAESGTSDEFDALNKEELRAWLDERGIAYSGNAGEKRLRELCRGAE